MPTLRQNGTLLISAVFCLALPLFARHQLNKRVSVDLAARASQTLGLPIQLGEASVGLTGTLEIRDVRVGEFFHAKRVIASIAPSGGTSHGLAANEILIDSPHLDLEVDHAGHTNLDEMLARRNVSQGAKSSTKSSSNSHLRTLRFIGGTLSARLANLGTVDSHGITLWMRDGKAHALFGRTDIALQDGDFRASGTLSRAALDYERGTGLRRLLADGGAFSFQGPRGRALMQEVVVSAGLHGNSYQLSARTGVDRATGSLRIDASPANRSAVATFDEVPMALFAPWLPESIHPRNTQVTGAIHVAGPTRTTPLSLSLRALTLQGVRISEPALSQRELALDLTLDADVTVQEVAQQRTIAIHLGRLQTGALIVSGEASGQWRPGKTLPDLANLSLGLNELPCDAALDSLPAGLRPFLAGLELRGTLASKLALRVSSVLSADTHIDVDSGAEGCRVVTEPPAANTRALANTYEYRTPDGRTRILNRTNPMFVSYKSLPSYVPKAFVAAEDGRFFEHDGFDTHQIGRSLSIDLKKGKLLRGGSTISQQLVKNLFLHRRRSLARKLQEAVLTWRLEDNVSKKRILEIYLNIIELGDEHTYGIAQASERWFGISPDQLSILQTAFLAALTPEPTSMSRRIREAGGLDEQSAERVAVILRVMRRDKVISRSEYRKAKAERLRFVTRPERRTTALLDR